MPTKAFTCTAAAEIFLLKCLEAHSEWSRDVHRWWQKSVGGQAKFSGPTKRTIFFIFHIFLHFFLALLHRDSVRRGAKKWHVEARDDTCYRHANTKAVNHLLALFGICCKLQMTLFWWRWGLTAAYVAYSSLSYPQHDFNHQNITVHGTLIKVRILSEVIFARQTVTSTVLEPVSYGDIFVLGSKTALLHHTDSVAMVIFRLGQLKITQSAAIPTGSAWR